MSISDVKEIFNLKKVDDVVNIPTQARKTYVKYCFLTIIFQITLQISSFLLEASRELVAQDKILLGLVVFGVYQLRMVATMSVQLAKEYIGKKKEEILDLDSAHSAISIMQNVSGKVVFEDKLVKNSSILTNLKTYIMGYRRTIEQFIVLLISFGTFLISVVGAITVAKSKFSNSYLFTITILVTIFVVGLVEYRHISKIQNSHQQKANLRKQIEEEKNDVLNINPICQNHMQYMMNNFLNVLKEKFKVELGEDFKGNISSIKKNIILATGVILVVCDVVIDKGINNLNLNSFMEIITLSTIFSSILSNIGTQICSFSVFLSRKSEIDKEKPLFTEIMKEHKKATIKSEVTDEEIEIRPFNFSYGERFTLTNEKSITLSKGKLVLVRGESGAGKSTLLKIISGEIGYLPKRRTVKFFSEGKLGSHSFLDEITLGNLEVEKLINILKGVQIYDELLLKAKSKIEGLNMTSQELLMEYLGKYNEPLSTGMQERVLLAQTLYNIDECDLVLIDEPIGGLDSKTAIKVMQYIKNYAALYHNKVVLVTTHQYQLVTDLFDQVIDVQNNKISEN